ncbi:hypothetical protein [Schaalia sp. JY-X169]|uniref:hypothetical protein n=1 Tax=Schaalia sp. JY-X169 TaxID=2758572 RepID=UPI0015F6510B|nr:hypothetical protein [Schaalia sp. JY-X169]
MQKAIAAWHEDDWEAVCLMAPQSIELLSKAVLWEVNPALLAPMGAQDGEASLLKLVRGDPLSSSGMKTIGLGAALKRLATLDDSFPIPKARYARIADVRNGLVHIAQGATEPRAILVDCLRVADYLIPKLSTDRSDFYGSGFNTAEALLIQHQESVEATVKLKRAKSSKELADLRSNLDSSEFEEVVAMRESEKFSVAQDHFTSADATSVDQDCPECGFTGRLIGTPQVEGAVDWDVEKLGDGSWIPVPMGYWEIYFDPSAFACPVCRLKLLGRDELAAAHLPSSTLEVDRPDLDDPDFSLDELIEAESHYDVHGV